MHKPCSFDGCNKPRRANRLCNAHRMQMSKNGYLKPLQPWTRSLPEEERFWEKVKRQGPDECWEWQAATNIHGYGFAKSGDGPVLAHILSCRFSGVRIPDGAEIDHSCRNRKCVNPSHLRPVSSSGNKENHSGPQSNNTSGYRGVYWRKDTKSWEARVTSRGKDYACGRFPTSEQAGEVARQKRIELFTHNDIDREPAH